ncbi:hypothetical protein Ea357_036 [Erwinia phage Ea35-70]|uniref:Uncharacterized protein n=1 Tax=Erwinia phage Ea35-70 TaxID=1429768 RepID=W6ARV7_9CAUD|nr:hypothetical protein Ea357_036 [Erwinia phage Ea35-70]AHI60186.1 hypothetical protein Ea357_036 [Erwinia phage Ea35-70]
MSIYRIEIHPNATSGLTVLVSTAEGIRRLALVEGCSEQGAFVVIRDKVIRFYHWDVRREEDRALFNADGLARKALVGIEALLCKNKDWGFGGTRFLAFMTGGLKHRWNEYSNTRGFIRAEHHHLVHTRVDRREERVFVTLGDWAQHTPWNLRLDRKTPYSTKFREVVERLVRQEFDLPAVFDIN